MADLDQAIKLKGDFADALLARGGLHLEAGDESAAAADFQAGLKAAPDDLRTGAIVAESYSRTGRFERAVGYYDKVIGSHTQAADIGELLNGRCRARALWGRELDQALADCDAAVRSWRTAASLDSRGLVHLRRGEFDLAIADYDAALKMQPKIPWSLFGRSLARAKKGDAAGSAADLGAAEALAPDIRARAKRYGITEETVVALHAPQS
jgi:tetratricopeptide (TPR) repeat protein